MYFLYFLCLLVMFQETVYAVIGLSGAALFMMRTIVDVSSVLLLLAVVIDRSIQGRSIVLSGIRYERIMVLFLIWCVLISAVTIEARFLVSLNEIVVLNRFVFLAIAVPYIVNTEEKIRKFLRFLWLLILIQAGIGVLQQLGGPAVVRAFAPNDFGNILTGAARSFTSNRDLVRDTLIGTLGDFVSFAYIMFFGIIMIIARRQIGLRQQAVLVLLLGLTFLSGSRTVFLGAFLFGLLTVLKNTRLSVRFLLVICIFPTVMIITSLLGEAASVAEFEYSSYLSLFSPTIIEVLMNQRLGHLVLYMPVLITDPVVITGFSGDRGFAEDYVNLNYANDIPFIWRATFNATLEDFYPVALITYYGLVGATLFYLAQFRIFSASRKDRKSDSPILRLTANQVFLAIIAVNLLSFGNQSFETRALAFVFWMSVGLYASARNLYFRVDEPKFEG